MLPKLLIAVTVIVVAALVFKDKLPASIQTNIQTAQQATNQKASVKAMSFDDVLALGGTCFKSPFIDQTKDVLASTEGGARVKAEDKDEYDINRIAIGVEGDSLISMWEFVGQIDNTWLNNHNISVQTYYELPKSHGYRVEVRKEARSAVWYGEAVPSNGGETEGFDPMVQMMSKSILFSIPLKYVSDKGVVDGLTFVGLFYEKPTSTMYTDDLPVPRAKANPKGGFTSWFCAYL